MSDSTVGAIVGVFMNLLALGGGAGVLIPYLARYILEQFKKAQELKQETIRKESEESQKKIALLRELEETKKKNSDDAIRATQDNQRVMNTALLAATEDIKDLKLDLRAAKDSNKDLQTQLRHSEESLALFVSYIPYLETVKAASDLLEERKKHSSPGVSPPPVQDPLPPSARIIKGDTQKE